MSLHLVNQTGSNNNWWDNLRMKYRDYFRRMVRELLNVMLSRLNLRLILTSKNKQLWYVCVDSQSFRSWLYNLDQHLDRQLWSVRSRKVPARSMTLAD